MKIILYENTNPVNMVNKTLENGVEINGKLHGETSILTPSIVIEKDVETIGYNYAFIPSFNRYYFITDITSVNNKLSKLEMKVDVLMSFATDIKQSLGKAKQAILVNGYYEKMDISTEVRTTKEILNFPNIPFDEKGEIILVAINGTGVV